MQKLNLNVIIICLTALACSYMISNAINEYGESYRFELKSIGDSSMLKLDRKTGIASYGPMRSTRGAGDAWRNLPDYPDTLDFSIKPDNMTTKEFKKAHGQ